MVLQSRKSFIYSLALFTLLGVATLEGWFDIVQEMVNADSIPEDARSTYSGRSAGILFYFVSYVVLVGYIITNVVLAILIDNYNQAVELEEMRQAQFHLDKFHVKNPLDPLLAELMLFESKRDLKQRICRLFEFLDVDGSGELSEHEIISGFRRLALEPPIHMSSEDFDSLAEGGRWIDPDHGVIRPHHFEVGRLSLSSHSDVARHKSCRPGDTWFMHRVYGL